MMTQGFYQSNAGAGFREYLTSSMNDMFSLDLSRCTLIECIDKMCKIKSRSHPKIKQNYRMLVNKLEDIERQLAELAPTEIISGSETVAQGDNVLKYGEVIGRARCDIRPGDHVHTDNLS